MRRLSPLGFYSKAAEKAQELPEGSFPAQQLISTLINKGSGKDELRHAGLIGDDDKPHPDWANRGKITKQNLIDHLHSSMPQVSQVVHTPDLKPEIADAKQRLHELKVQMRDADPSEYAALARQSESVFQELIDLRDRDANILFPAKYAEYTLPNQKNYREVLLHLPEREPNIDWEDYTRQYLKGFGTDYDTLPDSAQQEYMELAKKQAKQVKLGNFRSGHWDQPNVLAHVRMSDRLGPNGEKVLHVEEIQSDWGQKGRQEGFYNKKAADLKAQKERELTELENERGRKVSQSHDEWSNLLKDFHAEYRQFQKANEDLFHSGKKSDIDKYNQMSDELMEKHKDIIALANSKRAQTQKAVRDEYNPKIESLKEEIKNLPKIGEIPEGPYVGKTADWTDLALKRVLHEAAHGGYDQVVWTPGQQHANRYGLRNYVKKVAYDPEEKLFSYQPKNSASTEYHDSKVEPEELGKIIGEEAAKKLLSQPLEYGEHVLNTPDLEFGGEGMKTYYDKIIPQRIQKLAQKHDPQAKVGMSNVILPPDVERGDENKPVQPVGLTITPQMRQSILQGQEAFADGGSVKEDDGITAYHGSPHDFDQFDISKIGTGEGAQAYGHGLYFAQNEDVAKEYRDKLSRQMSFDNAPVANIHPSDSSMAQAIHAVAALVANGSEPHEAIKKAAKEWKDSAEPYKKFAAENPQHAERALQQAKSFQEIADKILAIDPAKISKNPGHMYEVHIKAHPDHMLDWDKPLNDQHPHILQSLFAARKENPSLWNRIQPHIESDLTAGDVYQKIAAGHPQGYAGASEWLSRAGIKGIKYLDGSSRAAGEGFRNFVVFDHNHVKVRRKYEQGGAVG